jgi:hypothetical protein
MNARFIFSYYPDFDRRRRWKYERTVKFADGTKWEIGGDVAVPELSGLGSRQIIGVDERRGETVITLEDVRAQSQMSRAFRDDPDSRLAAGGWQPVA